MKKQFFRVKHLADQTVGRAEKTEVLSEDLLGVEKRVESIRHASHCFVKKLSSGLTGHSLDLEKRLKKIPETYLASSLVEYSVLVGEITPMGSALRFCGEAMSFVGRDTLEYELDLERKVFQPMNNILENYMPIINKFKKQLNKQTLEMDISKTRYNEMLRRSYCSVNDANANANKLEALKEDYTDSCNKLDHIKDAYATEMFKFLSKEGEISNIILNVLEAKIEYHKNVLVMLENVLHKARDNISSSQMKPAFGCPLQEYLDVTNTYVSPIIEECVTMLLDIGLDEVGLFRMTGSTSKMKKLKSAFDSGSIVDLHDFMQDPHVITGILKWYLRDLPEPLLTYKLYNDWCQTATMDETIKESSNIKDQSTHNNTESSNTPSSVKHRLIDPQLHAKKIAKFKQLLKRLPRANYDNLNYLIQFLSQIVKHSNINLMTSSNLGIVIGPNLLWKQGDTGMDLINTNTQNSIAEFLIVNSAELFPKELDFRTYVNLKPDVKEVPESVLPEDQHHFIEGGGEHHHFRILGKTLPSIASCDGAQERGEEEEEELKATNMLPSPIITPKKDLTYEEDNNTDTDTNRLRFKRWQQQQQPSRDVLIKPNKTVSNDNINFGINLDLNKRNNVSSPVLTTTPEVKSSASSSSSKQRQKQLIEAIATSGSNRLEKAAPLSKFRTETGADIKGTTPHFSTAISHHASLLLKNTFEEDDKVSTVSEPAVLQITSNALSFGGPPPPFHVFGGHPKLSPLPPRDTISSIINTPQISSSSNNNNRLRRRNPIVKKTAVKNYASSTTPQIPEASAVAIDDSFSTTVTTYNPCSPSSMMTRSFQESDLIRRRVSSKNATNHHVISNTGNTTDAPLKPLSSMFQRHHLSNINLSSSPPGVSIIAPPARQLNTDDNNTITTMFVSGSQPPSLYTKDLICMKAAPNFASPLLLPPKNQKRKDLVPFKSEYPELDISSAFSEQLEDTTTFNDTTLSSSKNDPPFNRATKAITSNHLSDIIPVPPYRSRRSANKVEASPPPLKLIPREPETATITKFVPNSSSPYNKYKASTAIVAMPDYLKGSTRLDGTGQLFSHLSSPPPSCYDVCPLADEESFIDDNNATADDDNDDSFNSISNNQNNQRNDSKFSGIFIPTESSASSFSTDTSELIFDTRHGNNHNVNTFFLNKSLTGDKHTPHSNNDKDENSSQGKRRSFTPTCSTMSLINCSKVKPPPTLPPPPKLKR